MTTKHTERIAFETLGGFSKLFVDAVSGKSSNVPVESPRLLADGWRARCGAIDNVFEDRDKEAWSAVVDDIASLSARLGTSDNVCAKLNSAKQGKTLFVVTGQQPGALGGPMHTIYKIATAIAAAARFEKELARPVVPLYWCGSDDTDFQEIRELNFLTDGLGPASASVAREAYQVGMPVGGIATEALGKLWRGVFGFFDKLPEFDFVQKTIDAAMASARDHGELSAALLVRLFAGQVAVVDARVGSVKRFAQPMFSGYLDDEPRLKELVRAQGVSLEEAGYHAQLSVGDDAGVFLLKSGLRKSVSAENRAELLAAVRENIETCSPGVIVRNLIQDYTFRPLAVVLGPAELAYRAQISPLYEALGLARPVEFSRMSATWLPPDIKHLVKSEADWEAIVIDPSGFKKRLYRRSLPPQLADSLATFDNDIVQTLEKFTDKIGDAVPEKSAAKIRSRVGEVRGRIGAVTDAVYDAGKTLTQKNWPFVNDLEEILKPKGKLQERTLSVLMPFSWGGANVTELLLAMAAAHVGDAIDGDAAHIVYLIRP